MEMDEQMNGTVPVSPPSMATQRFVKIGERSFTLVGTAHVSSASIDEVITVIRTVMPDRICVELDDARYKAMINPASWEQMDIVKIIKEGKVFFMLANLALSSFQRRMGTGIQPGREMLAAIETAQELDIPFSLCDRPVPITLKRAWSKSNFWNKSKLIAQLIAAAFSNEKPDEEEIEKLKNASELDYMMEEMASYLPSVKEVLIDERDKYLASKIWEAQGNNVVAVVGAGHMKGIEAWLHRFAGGESADVSSFEVLPPKSVLSKYSGLLFPLILLGLIVAGFFTSGILKSVEMLAQWWLLSGTLSAIGTALCWVHPVSIPIAFLSAPIGTISPVLAMGMFPALFEAWIHKPRVEDFQNLMSDVASLKGFYKNKITHILLVFIMSSLGGAIGNIISVPTLAMHLK